jgi:hypothetical protein
MGVGPDGGCGGSSDGGDSWAHDTAAALRASASETEARTLIMAADGTTQARDSSDSGEPKVGYFRHLSGYAEDRTMEEGSTEDAWC